MSEFNFQIGDVVRLKSGGPWMTIERYTYNPETKNNFTDRVTCVWLNGSETHRETFLLITLVPQ